VFGVEPRAVALKVANAAHEQPLQRVEEACLARTVRASDKDNIAANIELLAFIERAEAFDGDAPQHR
jgi:hypothetical protein